jgi:quinol monooxygenase YgiN
MIIVQGEFVLEPGDRDRFVESSAQEMRDSRHDDGCLEYVIVADPLDDRRVVLSARWESMEHLQAHHVKAEARNEAKRNASAWPAMKSHDIALYEVVQARSATALTSE